MLVKKDTYQILIQNDVFDLFTIIIHENPSILRHFLIQFYIIKQWIFWLELIKERIFVLNDFFQISEILRVMRSLTDDCLTYVTLSTLD